MKRNAGIIIIAAIIVIGAGITLAAVGHHNSKQPAKSDTTMSMGQQQPTYINNKVPVATNMVTIQDFAFEPTNITVKKGTTVTWTNQDSYAHTVTESDGQPGPNSGQLAPGQHATYSYTYATVGTFAYHCTNHPGMKGTVKVTE